MARRLLTASLLATLAMLPLGGAALAAVPSIGHDRHVEISGFFYASCDGFDLLVDATVDLRDVVYYDAAETPVRESFSGVWHGRLYNSVSGKAVDDSGTFNNQTDLLTGVTRSSGAVRHDTVPHLGVVLLDAGTALVDASGGVIFASAHVQPAPTRSGDLASACAWFGS